MNHSLAGNDEVDQEIEALRQQFGLPGITWAVAPLDGPILAGATGLRRLGQPERLTIHDRMHLGSCTKPMTATMLASLVPDVLRWNTRISDVFPAGHVHPDYHHVTLEQLLAHLSGLPPFTQDEEFSDAPAGHGSRSEQRKAFALHALRQPPRWGPGEYGYSNAGFGVAAAMAELATGEAWEDLLHAHVFEALAIHSGGFGWPGRQDAAQPWGHWQRDGVLVPHSPDGEYQLPAGIAPAGDVHMHVVDFAVFARDHARGLTGRKAVLDPATYERVHTPLLDGGDSGLGWGVSRYRGRRASSHSGSAQTFRAMLLVLPDEGHAIVLATNAGGDQERVGFMHVLKYLTAQFTSAHVEVD